MTLKEGETSETVEPGKPSSKSDASPKISDKDDKNKDGPEVVQGDMQMHS